MTAAYVKALVVAHVARSVSRTSSAAAVVCHLRRCPPDRTRGKVRDQPELASEGRLQTGLIDVFQDFGDMKLDPPFWMAGSWLPHSAPAFQRESDVMARSRSLSGSMGGMFMTDSIGRQRGVVVSC